MRRPSPSLVVAVLALVVATSGTSYAAAKIGANDIRKDAIRSKHLKNDTVRSKDIKDGAVKRKDLSPSIQNTLNAQSTRWVLVNAAGQIEAQSGGFTMKAAYPTLANTAQPPAPSNAARAAGNVYIDAGEDLTKAGLVATIALQNQVDQNGDGITNGRAGGEDANPEFSGEISATTCGLAGVVACAPDGTNNTSHFVVSPRMSDGSVTDADTRKRFYVVISKN